MLMRFQLIAYLTATSLQAVMRKSLYSTENKEIRAQLRKVREDAGLTQAELSAEFGRLQSFASTVERGLVRLDLAQARRWCAACGTTLPAFVGALEERLRALAQARGVRKKRLVR
jgi:transcriptional regulator with XRE-family HTH domain